MPMSEHRPKPGETIPEPDGCRPDRLQWYAVVPGSAEAQALVAAEQATKREANERRAREAHDRAAVRLHDEVVAAARRWPNRLEVVERHARTRGDDFLLPASEVEAIVTAGICEAMSDA